MYTLSLAAVTIPLPPNLLFLDHLATSNLAQPAYALVGTAIVMACDKPSEHEPESDPYCEIHDCEFGSGPDKQGVYTSSSRRYLLTLIWR